MFLLFIASVVVVMVDAANKHTRERLDRNIVRILQANRHIPSMLVLNKVKVSCDVFVVECKTF